MNNETILSFFVSLAAAALMTWLADTCINRLYAIGQQALSFPDNIPERSRWRKPALALLYLAAVWFIAPSLPAPPALYRLAAAFFLILIAMTDWEQYVIFDRVLLPFAVCGLLAALHLGAPLIGRLLASLIGGAAFFLLAALTRGGIGGGDVKLIAALGLWLGLEKLPTAVTLGLIIGGLAAVLLLLAKKKQRGQFFAYGPYFALTALWLLIK